MKRLTLVTALFAATMANSGLHAQLADIRANIPFDFWMQDARVPAGVYLLHFSDHALILRDLNGRVHGGICMTSPTLQLVAPAGASLKFHAYAGQYFLAEASIPGSRDGFSLPATRQEKELARRRIPGETVAVNLPAR